jgi:hypothetical protein
VEAVPVVARAAVLVVEQAEALVARAEALVAAVPALVALGVAPALVAADRPRPVRTRIRPATQPMCGRRISPHQRNEIERRPPRAAFPFSTFRPPDLSSTSIRSAGPTT